MQKTPFNYQRDVKYATRIVRQIMIALGVWPSEGSTTRERIVKFLLLVVSQAMLACTVMPVVLCWLTERETHARLRMFPSILFGFVCSSKFGSLILRRSQLRYCLRRLEEDWRTLGATSARGVMLESAEIGRRLVAICGAFLYSGGMCYAAILPLTVEKLYDENNNTIRRLPYPTYLFSLNTQASPVFEIMYAIQSAGGMVALLVSLVACGLVVVFVMHACGQLRILMNLMQSFVEEWREEREIDKKLATLVEHQIRLRSFVQSVELAMQQVCLVEIAGATILLCFLGYLMIMEWEKSNAIAMCSYFTSLVSAIVNMFMYCYTGERLIVQAEKAAVMSCELEWNRLPDKKARAVVLVMIMSNAPTTITVGNIFTLSLKTFGDILRTSAAYFNMLRNVTA